MSSSSDSDSAASSNEVSFESSSDEQLPSSSSNAAAESNASSSSTAPPKVEKDLHKAVPASSDAASRPKISKTTSMMPSVGKKSVKSTGSSATLKLGDKKANKGAPSTMRVSDKEKNIRKKIDMPEQSVEKIAPISADVRFGSSQFSNVNGSPFFSRFVFALPWPPSMEKLGLVSSKIDKIKDLGTEDAPDDQTVPYTDNPAPEPRRKKHRVRVVGDASRVPSIKITVGCPDGSTHIITATANFTGRELYHAFVDKINLWQDEFFTLAMMESSSSLRFIKPSVEIGDQGIKDGYKLVLVLKYGKTPFRWADPVATRMMACSMNTLVANGLLSVPSKQSLPLAALQVVIRYGTGIAKTKTSFLTQELLSQFLPPNLMQLSPLDYLQQRVLFYYRKFTEKKQEQAEFDAAIQYCEMGRTHILGWGAYIITAMCESNPAEFGIVEDGFIFRLKNTVSSDLTHIPFESAQFTHERGSATIKFKCNGEKLKLQCHKLDADQLHDIFDGFLYILARQNNQINATLPSEDTPYYLHLSRPIDRQKQAAELKPAKSSKKISLLATLQQVYTNRCKAANLKPLNRLLLQLDTKIDSGETHDSLDLRRCNLDDAALSVVYDAVEEVMTLMKDEKSVKKYKQDFTPKKLLVSANERLSSSAAMCKLLSLCGLTLIDASDCALTADASRHLASALKQTNTLEDLSLDRNIDIGAQGIKNILDVLRSQPQFKSLSLISCGITKEAADDIKSFFENSKSIQIVGLADNKIGDSAMQSILQSAEKAKGSLISLDLTNTQMGQKSADALKTFLEGEDKIKVIKIGYNTFPSSVGKIIANIIPEGDILEELDISRIGIGSKATAPIFTSLSKNKTIRRLNLSYNPIEKNLASALEDFIAENDHIEYLSLRSCDLDKTLMIAVANAVARNKTLKELDLSGNRLDSVEAQEAWTTALISNTTLKIIFFSACKMDSSCGDVFAEVLKENKVLERLHLDGNNVNRGLAYLADGLAANRTLRILTLQQCSLRQDYLEEFLSRFSGSSALELLDVRGNKFKHVDHLKKLAAKFNHLDLKF